MGNQSFKIFNKNSGKLVPEELLGDFYVNPSGDIYVVVEEFEKDGNHKTVKLEKTEDFYEVK